MLTLNKKEVAVDNYINTHFTKRQGLKTHIGNQFIVNESKFDIITLSETWLKNDKYLLEYVNLPGSKFSYRNRDEKRGGGVGIYI